MVVFAEDKQQCSITNSRDKGGLYLALTADCFIPDKREQSSLPPKPGYFSRSDSEKPATGFDRTSARLTTTM